MIRLIATDMDGTLVKSDKQLPLEIFPIVKELERRGIQFVVASGRQYYNLLEAFQGNKNITYIAENGAVIYEKGKNIYADRMDIAHIKHLIAPIRALEDAYPVFCGIESAYIEDMDAEFVENAKLYFRRCESLSDIMDAVKMDDICKIAIYDKRGVEINSYPNLKAYCSDVKLVTSGEHWADIANVGITKGRAIEYLQGRYGIDRAECMAFGDFFNDLEMLLACEYSFAMANGHPEIKEAARFIAKSNDEMGVIDVIRELLESGKDGKWQVDGSCGITDAM